MQSPSTPSANLNALAKFVSNAGFKRFIFDADFKKYIKQLKNVLHKNGQVIEEKCSAKDLIQYSYEHLLENYRHEYLYKTALLNSFVLKNHSLNDTVLLNEFKVGNSKADMVLVNGTNKVFEIKTELDSPERLNSQINDYFKAFSEVYIVVHHSLVHKYIGLIDPSVGIMSFSPLNEIEIEYRATPDQSRLDIGVMLRALRKEEYLLLIERLAGYIPSVKAIHLFSACMDLASSFAPENVQYEFLKIIKQRINPYTNAMTSNAELPDYLRFSCYHSNLNQNDYIALIKRLNYQF